MMRVANAVAATLLSKDRYRFLGELIALTRNIPPIPREVYADAEPANVVMLVEQYPQTDSPTVTFSSYDAALLRDALAGVLSTMEKFRLLSVDRRVFEAFELNAALEVGKLICWRSFVCTCLGKVPCVERSAVALTGTDEEAFVEYLLEDRTGRPGRADLFRWLVKEGRGEILAVKDGEEILGYLSCSPEYEDVWDVEYVHVREDMRRRGLGTVLASSYAGARLTRGQVPYWSGAANEASERTAMKASFVCCRELFCVEATAKPGRR
jgi:GNAT superfamily N-acetyltransferase